MVKATIYGKTPWRVLDTIYDVEDYYCINGMFYIKTKEREYYFALDITGVIRIDAESENTE